MDVYLATGEYEVAPYIIDHPFYKSANTLIMNLKKWNSLPDHLKKIIEEVQLETEKAWPALWENEVAMMKKKAVENGAKFITLDPDTAEWFTEYILLGRMEICRKKFLARRCKTIQGARNEIDLA